MLVKRFAKRHSHSFPEIKSVLESLKHCSKTRDLKHGLKLHQDAIAHGSHTNKFIATALINMYSKCGQMQSACDVFDKMPRKDIAMWNSLILGYAENWELHKALDLFAKVNCEERTSVTYLGALKACAGMATRSDKEKEMLLQKAIGIHKQLREGGFESNLAVSSTLVDMYSKLGDMRSARAVFDRMTVRNVVTWNCLIRGYVENGSFMKALDLFSNMDCEPDYVTFLAAIKACAGLADENESEKLFCLERGFAIHERIKKLALDSELVLSRNLIDMYGKCSSMDNSFIVFNKMARKDTVTWNTLLLGCVENGKATLALEMFSRMDCEADSVTYVVVIKACSFLAETDKLSAVKNGEKLHMDIREQGFESNLVVASSLMDMYFKCDCVLDALDVFSRMKHRDIVTWNCLVARFAENGSMQSAREAFDKMPAQNALTWNSLLLGYVESDDSLLALELFTRMECDPTCITFVAALKASANLGALTIGRLVHAQLCKLGLEHVQVVVNSLVDFYGKCGKTSTAETLLNGLESPDIVSWNALLCGYSMVGDAPKVFGLASQVMETGLRMTPVTFVCVLTACSHAGLVERGKRWYRFMTKEYGLCPSLEHNNCMIDILGRANRLEEAVEFVEGMPLEANKVTWKTLLGACRKWNNVDVGKYAFESFLEGEFKDAAPYVLMGNIFGRSPDKSKTCLF